MHAVTCLFKPRQVEALAARRTGTDKNGVIVLAQDLAHAVDFSVEEGGNPHIEDVVHFFVQHFQRQPERGNLAAHHAATSDLVVEDVDVVAKGHEIPCHRQRRRTSADARDLLAILLRRYGWQPVDDAVLVVGGDTLQPADRHRLFLDTTAATGWLAGPVAGSAKHTREYVGFPVDHVRVGIALHRNEPDVLGNRRMCGTGVLAIHDFVEVLGVADIGCFHVSKP